MRVSSDSARNRFHFPSFNSINLATHCNRQNWFSKKQILTRLKARQHFYFSWNWKFLVIQHALMLIFFDRQSQFSRQNDWISKGKLSFLFTIFLFQSQSCFGSSPKKIITLGRTYVPEDCFHDYISGLKIHQFP